MINHASPGLKSVPGVEELTGIDEPIRQHRINDECDQRQQDRAAHFFLAEPYGEAG